jgi:hypothetical protein
MNVGIGFVGHLQKTSSLDRLLKTLQWHIGFGG